MSFLKHLMLAGLTFMLSANILAVELPAPAKLMAQNSLLSLKVSVVEPHESTIDRLVAVDYLALPMNDLLTKWFGNLWKTEDTEIVLFAKDGYRSVIASSKLKKYRAFLAFARDDGSAFVVDNMGQNQNQIPLGPYYLIWENRGVPDLLRQGANDWPYQIISIELHRKIENKVLIPRKLSFDLEQGMAETQKFCLTCHNIRGVGGEKYTIDLIKASCRWPDSDLKAWIESPNRLKPGATMPSLGRTLPAKERNQIIEHIVNYLTALKKEQPGACIK